MIAIRIDAFFSLLICVSVLVMALLWARQLWRSISRYWEVSEEQISHCPNCQYTFFIKPRQILTICPACGKRVRVRLSKAAKHLRY